MNRNFLICAATLALCAVGHAQPATAPAESPAVAATVPAIDAEVQQFIEAMIARYAALKSYSDVTELRLENAAGAPTDGGGWMSDMKFRATLQWERPARIRFEGRDSEGAFLALGTDAITRIVSARYPKHYIARPRAYVAKGVTAEGAPYEVTTPFQLEEPLMGSPIPGSPSMGFMLDDGKFWPRTLKDVTALNFDPDATVDGEACRLVRIQILDDSAIKSVMRLFVAKSDGLLRRVEIRDDRMPADTLIVETHADVEVNPVLPATTWNFTPPQAATPVDNAMEMQEKTMNFAPDIKVGDVLPTFSADALNGAPLELNAASGKITILHFFTMNSGVYDVQLLNKIARAAGAEKLQIVGVSGDGLRPRVEAFAARYKLDFPIYFDETGRTNKLARKFGVKGWASTFIFGADGKLQFIGGRPVGLDTTQAMRKVLPTVGAEAFAFKDGEYLDAE